MTTAANRQTLVNVQSARVVNLGAAGTLTPLDRATETLCQKNWIRYQRFMDDYMIFAKTHNKLKAAIKRVYAVLEPFSCKIQAN